MRKANQNLKSLWTKLMNSTSPSTMVWQRAFQKQWNNVNRPKRLTTRQKKMTRKQDQLISNHCFNRQYIREIKIHRCRRKLTKSNNLFLNYILLKYTQFESKKKKRKFYNNYVGEMNPSTEFPCFFVIWVFHPFFNFHLWR